MKKPIIDGDNGGGQIENFNRNFSRDFKGIWIPKEIWLSPILSMWEKVLFAEIYSLDNEKGCYASNKYFAIFFKVSERQIRNHLRSLKEKGFIGINIKNRNTRLIRTIGKYRRVSDQDIQEVQKMRGDLKDKFTVDKG